MPLLPVLQGPDSVMLGQSEPQMLPEGKLSEPFGSDSVKRSLTAFMIAWLTNSWKNWPYFLLPDGIHTLYFTDYFYLLPLGYSIWRILFQSVLEDVSLFIKDVALNGFRYRGCDVRFVKMLRQKHSYPAEGRGARRWRCAQQYVLCKNQWSWCAWTTSCRAV